MVAAHMVGFEIGERLAAEAVQRESEERQTFLLRLSDALRPVTDPLETQRTASRILREQLGADRVAYAEIEPDEDTCWLLAEDRADHVPPFPSNTYVWSDFDPVGHSSAKQGRSVSRSDVQADDDLTPTQKATFAAVGFRALINVPLLKSGRLVAFIAVHFHRPFKATPTEIGLVEETAERTWAAVRSARSEAAFRQSEERLRGFGEASSDVLWIRDIETLRWVYLTPAFEEVYSLSREEALSGNDFRRWTELIIPEDRDHALDSIRRVQAGERVTFEYRIHRPADGSIRRIRDTDFPIRDLRGIIYAIRGVGHDVTEERAMEERQKILFAELQHRTRNLIGVVRAMSDRTAAGSVTLEAFLPRFRERLGALSRVNTLLSKLDSGERVTFDELIRNDLGARGILDDGKSERVVLDGPAGVRLRSAVVQTFALALHELTTNAVKYGALADGTGRLQIAWRRHRDGAGLERLQVEWIETGVADMPETDDAPRGGGYGRMLIERALPYQLGATTTHELRPGGVRCTIDLPLR